MIEGRSLIRVIANNKFDKIEIFLTIVKELFVQFQNVRPNARLIMDLLDLVRKNSVMQFNGEYFQQNLVSLRDKLCTDFSEYL